MPPIALPPDALLPSISRDSFAVMSIGAFALVLVIILLIKLAIIWTTNRLASKLDWLLKLAGLGTAWGDSTLRAELRHCIRLIVFAQCTVSTAGFPWFTTNVRGALRDARKGFQKLESSIISFGRVTTQAVQGPAVREQRPTTAGPSQNQVELQDVRPEAEADGRPRGEEGGRPGAEVGQ